MYCPDCGTENARSQKFCTRCGANLLAIDRARNLVSEVATGGSNLPVEGSTILKSVAAISISGFLFVTIASVVLAAIDGEQKTPIPVFVALGGYTAIVLICRRLLDILKTSGKSSDLLRQIPSPNASSINSGSSGNTNRSLSEASFSPYSITEQSTRQFEER
jgi:hypothetical protein